MKINNSLPTKAFATLLSALALCSPAAKASDIPEFMKEFVNEGKPASKQQIAFDEIYALNDEMFTVYEKSISIYRKNFLAHNNLIMALFSPKGGRFILYRAGQPPIEADSPPAVYRMAKSVGHCAMATYTLVAPYVENPSADLSWLAEMKVYRTRVQTTMEALDVAELKSEDRDLLKDALKQIAAFMDKCIQNRTFTFAELEGFARGIKPDLVKLIGVATTAQVGHWWTVMEEWKKLLGKDWDKTYGLSNAIYVARQNNILYSVLVQFFGEEKMNDRLLLMETTDFTTTPETMLDGFMRIISDRGIGELFYKYPRLMDYELLGGGGRKAIEAEATKRGLKPILPPLVPFNSHGWPWKTDPSTGSGPASLDDIH